MPAGKKYLTLFPPLTLILSFRNALIDYVEMVCKQISKRFVKPPEWWTPPTLYAPTPSLHIPDQKCFEDKKNGNSRYCTRCQEEVDAEAAARKEEVEKEAEEKKSKGDTRKAMRERMKKRALEQKKGANAAATKKRKPM